MLRNLIRTTGFFSGTESFEESRLFISLDTCRIETDLWRSSFSEGGINQVGGETLLSRVGMEAKLITKVLEIF